MKDKNFLKNVMFTYATKIALLGFGFGVTVLTARVLGPEDRGLYVYATVLASTAIQVLSFGLPTLANYHVAKYPGRISYYMGAALIYALFVGGLCGLGGGLYYFIQGDFGDLTILLMVLVLIWIPVGILNTFFQNISLATGNVKLYNSIELFFGGVASLAALLLVFSGMVTPGNLYLSGFLVVSLSTVFYFRFLSKRAPIFLSLSMHHVKSEWKYALKIYAASIFSFLLIKSDIFIVEYYLGKEAVGNYSISVGLFDALYMFPVILGTILFPRLSALGNDKEKWKITKPICIYTGFCASVVWLVMFFSAELIIITLFGHAYHDSVLPFIYLLPGFVFLSMNTVIMNFFSSIGAPSMVIFGPLLGFLGNISGNMVLVPRFGIEGAAISSSLSYGLMLSLSLVYITMKTFGQGQTPADE